MDRHAPDVGFIDIGVELNLPQILGNGEQRRALRARPYGLAHGDVAIDHDAVDRRPDQGAVEIELDLVNGGLAGADGRERVAQLRLSHLGIRLRGGHCGLGGGGVRPGRGEGGVRDVVGRLGSLRVGLGRIAGQAQLALALVVALGVDQREFGVLDVRLCAQERRLRGLNPALCAFQLAARDVDRATRHIEIGLCLVETRRDERRIQPRQNLPRLDHAVEVDQHLDDLACRLRRHRHRLNGPDRARSAHGVDQGARLDLLEAVAEPGCLTAKEVVGPGHGNRHQQHDGENHA